MVVCPVAWHAVGVTQSSSAITPRQTAELYPGDIKSVLLTSERIQARMTSQGTASFSQAHREPGQAGGKVSDEAYRAMTPAQRLEYARQFDQSQFQSR